MPWLISVMPATPEGMRVGLNVDVDLPSLYTMLRPKLPSAELRIPIHYHDLIHSITSD